MSVWNSSNVYGEEIRFYFPFYLISRIKTPPNTILKAPRVSEDGGAFGMYMYSMCKVLGRHSFLKSSFSRY